MRRLLSLLVGTVLVWTGAVGSAHANTEPDRVAAIGHAATEFNQIYKIIQYPAWNDPCHVADPGYTFTTCWGAVRLTVLARPVTPGRFVEGTSVSATYVETFRCFDGTHWDFRPGRAITLSGWDSYTTASPWGELSARTNGTLKLSAWYQLHSPNPQWRREVNFRCGPGERAARTGVWLSNVRLTAIEHDRRIGVDVPGTYRVAEWNYLHGKSPV